MKKENLQKLIPILRNGGVGVLPTDTLYGIVGSALNEETVERIYALRKRNSQKPLIILISRPEDLRFFGIGLSAKEQEALQSFWPGKVSVVLACSQEKFTYLHRGQKSLAFRFPQEKWLREFLSETGPLVAPSANLEGEKPALTIADAKKYFDADIDFYFDAGELDSEPSTIVRLEKDGSAILLRRGGVEIR